MSIRTSEKIKEIGNSLDANDVATALLNLKRLVGEPLKSYEFERINQLLDTHWHKALVSLATKPLRLAILGGYTSQPISKALRAFLLGEGILTEVYEAEYGAYNFEVLNSDSYLYTFRPNIVLFLLGNTNITRFPEVLDTPEAVLSQATSFVGELSLLWTKLQQDTGALVIQTDLVPFPDNVLGRLEQRYQWSRNRYISAINALLWELDGKGVHILNVCDLATRIGLRNWYDARLYHYGKIGFSVNHLFDFAHLFIRLYRALMGRTRKCLVTDLDNTLWGGVIGDDGIGGIHLGNISPRGEAFHSFCSYLKLLKERGVILAVNSKNDPKIAREVFEKHPEMPLRLDDFAAFYCNWSNKSDNLRSIAEELNISLESLVFIDDNPVECAEVSRLLPEVEVVNMDGDPASFVIKLDNLGLFDQLEITREDFQRTASYVGSRKVVELQAKAHSIDDFLQGLEMIAMIRRTDPNDLPRVEQLFKRTNQFNLTDERYRFEELKGFLNDDNAFLLSCWLKDKFVDYGLVSAVAGIVEGNQLFIRNWVMSCRVFKRTLEEFVLKYLLQIARQMDCKTIHGLFKVTSKNNYVRDLYSSLGFSCTDSGEASEWVLDVQKSTQCKSFISEEQP